MANNENQKIKLLRVMEILERYSDENHPISAEEIIEKLGEYGISAERKSIYKDIDVLRDFGMEIDSTRKGYVLWTRTFDLPEIKILLDAVASSRFVTTKQSETIKEKLGRMISVYDSKTLNRNIQILGRIKSKSDNSILVVNEIHHALTEKYAISFDYRNWGMDKKLVSGRIRKVYPIALAYMNDNYYLIARDLEREDLATRSFRVDKVYGVKPINMDVPSEIKREHFDLPAFCNPKFNMYAGTEKMVTFLVDNKLIGVFIDRFGDGISIIKSDNDHFTVTLKIEESEQFYGWVSGLGNSIKIIEPESVKQGYIAFLEKLRKIYE